MAPSKALSGGNVVGISAPHVVDWEYLNGRQKRQRIGVSAPHVVDWECHETIGEIEENISEFRDLYLQLTSKGFIPGRKVTAVLELLDQQGIPVHGIQDFQANLRLKLRGGMLGRFSTEIPIQLPANITAKGSNIQEILPYIATPKLGGNGTNTLINLERFMADGIGPEAIHAFAPADRTFEHWMESRTHTKSRIHLKEVPEVTSRYAFQLPVGGGEVLSITSPPEQMIEGLRRHIAHLAQCHVLVATEPINSLYTENRELAKTTGHHLINVSNAFRGSFALSCRRYPEERIPTPFITMNNGEMSRHIAMMEERNFDIEIEMDVTNLFFSPFSQKRAFSRKYALLATQGLQRYFRMVPYDRDVEMCFPASISCNQDGGYSVMARKGKMYAIFSTIPGEDGENMLLSTVGRGNGFDRKVAHDAGAGDAVATVLLLANLWNIPGYLKGHCSAPKKLLRNAQYVTAASGLFISILKRLCGNLVFRTHQANLIELPDGAARKLVDCAAHYALEAANDIYQHINQAPSEQCATTIDALGIKASMWTVD